MSLVIHGCAVAHMHSRQNWGDSNIAAQYYTTLRLLEVTRRYGRLRDLASQVLLEELNGLPLRKTTMLQFYPNISPGARVAATNQRRFWLHGMVSPALSCVSCWNEPAADGGGFFNLACNTSAQLHVCLGSLLRSSSRLISRPLTDT